MNKRIQELLNEAHKQTNGGIYNGHLSEWTEKFAELIVRECCEWIDGTPSTDGGMIILTKSFIIANIKGHFGVEQ